MTRIRMLLIGTVLSVLAVAGTALAEETGTHVIGSGWEKDFLKMTNPGKKGFPGGWKLEAVSLKDAAAVLTYKAGKKQLVLNLVHPSTVEKPAASTKQFAIVPAGTTPAEELPPKVLAALSKRIDRYGKKFTWTLVTGSTASTASRSGPDRNKKSLKWEPEFPPEAVPFPRLAYRDYGLPSGEAEAWEQIRKALTEKKHDEAGKLARALAGRNPESVAVKRASAAALRTIGKGDEATALLEGATAARSRDLQLELAASLLQQKKEKAARKVLDKLAEGDKDLSATCALADALKVLVSEGRTEEAARLAPPLKEKSQRCVVFLHLNMAHVLDDDNALDKAAGIALKGYPDDHNMIYFWGVHYYEKMAFLKATPIWEKLVDMDPLYPAVAGQYGTAMLASDQLKPDGIKAQLKKLETRPDDPMASFLAGMGLYYQHEYAQAKPLLEVAAEAMPHESRGLLYLAMSNYFLGHIDVAKKMFEEMEPYAYHDPDVYYCRSLVYRKSDLKRAILEMEKFVDVFLGEGRLSFGPEKVKKALSDLERMKKGEIPELNLPHEPHQPPQ